MLAAEVMLIEPMEVRMELFERAYETVRQVGSPRDIARVVLLGGFAIWAPETRTRRRELSAEGVPAAIASGDPFIVFQAHSIGLNVLMEDGDVAAVDDTLARMAELASRLPHPVVHWALQFAQSMRALSKGDTDSAEQLAFQAFETGNDAGEQDAIMILGCQLMAIRWEQGRLDEVVDLLGEAVEDNPQIPSFRGPHMMALVDAGQTAEASAMLERSFADGFPELLPDLTWPVAVTYFGEVIRHLDAVAAAATLYKLVAPHRSYVVCPNVAVYNSLDRVAGVLAHVAGKHAAGDAHLRDALDIADRMDAPLFRARVRFDQGWALQRQGAQGPEVQAAFGEAAAIWRRCGCDVLADRAAEASRGVQVGR